MIKRKGLPNQNELVMCTVNRITPYAAWCDLDEYDAEGMIHVSQAASKWVHNIRDFIKQDKQYVAKVIKIDQEKNIINLSLKSMSKRDRKEKLNAYRQEQRSEKILEQAAKASKKTLKQAYDEVGYLLQEKFGELSTAFEDAKKDPEVLKEAGVPKKWIDKLMPIIEIAIKEKEFVLKAQIDLKSYEGDGLERVKKALSDIKKSGLDVSYISAPNYMVEMKTKDPKNDEKKIRDGLDKIIDNSKKLKVEMSYEMLKG